MVKGCVYKAEGKRLWRICSATSILHDQLHTYLHFEALLLIAGFVVIEQRKSNRKGIVTFQSGPCIVLLKSIFISNV